MYISKNFSNIKILLINNEKKTSNKIKKHLENLNYKIDIHNYNNLKFDKINKDKFFFDLIIIDNNQKNKKYKKFINNIREVNNGIPIITLLNPELHTDILKSIKQVEFNFLFKIYFNMHSLFLL